MTATTVPQAVAEADQTEVQTDEGPLTVPVNDDGELFPLGRLWEGLEPAVIELELVAATTTHDGANRLLAQTGVEPGRYGSELVRVVDALEDAVAVYKQIDAAYPDQPARYWPVEALKPHLQAEVRHSIAPLAQLYGHELEVADGADTLTTDGQGGED